MTQIRVLIVDDHEIVRLGLRTLLASEKDIKIIAEAETGKQALTQVEQHHPDVVVLDIQLPGQDGLSVCKQIKKQYPDIQVVMLTSSVDDSMVFNALRAGANGYILKQVGNDELIHAIYATQRGEMVLDPHSTSHLIKRFSELQHSVKASAFESLSSREIDVLAHLIHGKSNKEIGQDLGLSETTVRNYVSSMLSKLALRNRIELAVYAIQNDIGDYLSDSN